MSASKSLVSDLKLSGRLFQILGPTEYKLWIPRFVFRKGSFYFFVGRACNCTIITNRRGDFIEMVRTLIV